MSNIKNIGTSRKTISMSVKAPDKKYIVNSEEEPGELETR